MRKVIKYLTILLILILFPLTFTKATTKVNFSEDSNGIISTKIHFDEGFVGGIDLVLKLSDNVTVKNFTYSSDFKNCTKDYTFDSKNHTLTIKITSGGIGVGHNLLNEQKELVIGKISLNTNYKESIKYNLNISSITIVGNDWNSNTLKSNEYEIDGENTFNYIIKSSSTIPSDDDKNNGSTTNPSDKEDNNSSQDNDKNNSNNNVDNNQNNNSNSNNNTNVNENNSNTQNNDEENENNSSVIDDNNSLNDSNENDKDNSKDLIQNNTNNSEQNNNNLIII